MSKIKEIVYINGKKVAVSAKQLIEAHEVIKDLTEEVNYLQKRVFELEALINKEKVEV